MFAYEVRDRGEHHLVWLGFFPSWTARGQERDVLSAWGRMDWHKSLLGLPNFCGNALILQVLVI
jgi:hypothetical protein